MSRLVPAVLAVLALAPAASASPNLRLGFDDDTLKWMTRPNGVVGVQHDLGVRTTRITIPWRRGELRPRPVSQIYLSRAAKAIVLGQEIVIAVYGPASEAPVDAVARSQYCSYVHHVLAVIPKIAGVVIWNEANSPRYWPSSAGALAYEKLLARCWDMLHRLRHRVNVIDSTASHYDPAGFILSLGEAYRDSGRVRPIVDTFGHNPYPETASEFPWVPHPSTGTIGEGDYATLVDALTQAFQFTGQPLPSAEWPTLWYLEDGFQTAVPPLLRYLYTGRENDPFVIPPIGDGTSQAAQLRDAVYLAYCQPAVGAFFNFELIDEHRLVGWQSGVLYTNGTRKPSFLAFRDVVSTIARKKVDCSKVAGAPPPSPGPAPRSP
ncbi:MAG: hypothetical protein E6G32_14230 [Actinobacteria bacterium]|nr:MAG: hypothetical protein E6G32_14230 [Actinomycetota bacterium]